MDKESRNKHVKIDKISLDIIQLLGKGKQSFGQIAEKLAISEGTVRNRINKLERTGVLDRCGLVDVEALPGHMTILVGINLAPSFDCTKKAQELKGLRGVVSSLAVTGSHDIFLIVILNDEFGLLEFLNEELVAHSEGIQTIESFVVYKGFGFKLPYML